MLGGIDWHGIPIMAELFGITDYELFINQLILIRDFKSSK